MTLDLNIELVRKVQAAIRNEAIAFDMWSWIGGKEREAVLRGVPLSECQTTACIAGWVVLLSADEKKRESFVMNRELEDTISYAAERLGIERVVAHRLCYDDNWPKEVMERYDEAKAIGDHETAAEIACGLLDNLIASGGTSIES